MRKTLLLLLMTIVVFSFGGCSKKKEMKDIQRVKEP